MDKPYGNVSSVLKRPIVYYAGQTNSPGLTI